ncbi:hypothetical protein HaLaN_22737, partial [Haematococcus lacustris]
SVQNLYEAYLAAFKSISSDTATTSSTSAQSPTDVMLCGESDEQNAVCHEEEEISERDACHSLRPIMSSKPSSPPEKGK